MNQADLLTLLRETDARLMESKKWLERSYEVCLGIGKKPDYSAPEMDAFEAFSSRFARTSDILVQQVFRTIDAVELEPGGSILDRINRAEKRGYIRSARELRMIREIRNTIVHEYHQEDIIGLFHDMLDTTPVLLEAIEMTHDYVRKFLDS